MTHISSDRIYFDDTLLYVCNMVQLELKNNIIYVGNMQLYISIKPVNN